MPPRHNLPEDTRLDRQIRELNRRIEDLERLTRAPSTSIDNGATVVRKDGYPISVLGDLSRGGYANINRPDGTAQMGWVLNRDTGELAFIMWDPNPEALGYQQFWSWWDRSGRIIFSDDADSGWGLGQPRLSASQWLTLDQTNWPKTTSATFVNAWENYFYVQHNKLYIDFLMFCEASTSGEVRLMVDGTQYGPTIAGSAGYSTFSEVIQLTQDLHQTYAQLRIEYRRTTGTGQVSAYPRITYGRQS